MNVPAAGPTNDAPYAPQPILQGGVVIQLYPPDSTHLNKERVREAEQYSMSKAAPGRISSDHSGGGWRAPDFECRFGER